jgi:signal transduction histidine kinase
VTFDGSFLAGAAIGLIAGAAVVALVLRQRIARRLRRAAAAKHRHTLAGAAPTAGVSEAGSVTSGLAHEIKNPLSSIVLNAQLLRESILDAGLPDDASQRLVRRIDSLARETGRLKDILEDFLRFAGRIRLDSAECDLREVAEDLTDFIHPQCDRDGVLLRADMPRAPVRARVDAGLLKQALLNLMLNAVQAMESDSRDQRKELIVRVDPADSSATARIHVIDTGPGIPDHLREEIFRPYVTTKKGGSGLGLAVAKRIIEEHGGSIGIFSEEGRGSDFVVTLPVGAPTPKA